MKLLIICSFLLTSLVAEEIKPTDGLRGFKKDYGLSLKTVYYLDNRHFNTLSITTAASKLPYNLSFWGFTDFHGNQLPPRDRLRLTRSFSEYRLTFDLEEMTGVKGLGFQAEHNFFSTSNKHIFRFGPVYKHRLPFLRKGSWLQWRAHPLQTDDNLQVSLIYKISLSEKWSFSGFADYNINNGQQDRWVIEPQLNYQLNKYISCHLEYRYNGFEDANDALRGHGVAIGLGLKF